MFDFFYETHQNTQIYAAKFQAQNAQRKASKADRNVMFLQWKVEKLTMVTEALWTILKEKHNLKDQDLKDLVDDVFSSEYINKLNIFNYDGVNRFQKLDAAGKIDANYPIFSMECIEVWCQILLDK